MKNVHKLFFAIPFDSATKNQYERITKQLRDKYPAITTVIGNTESSPSPQYSEITTFKAQNRDLHQQFTKQITEADIVIADLTHNNPNVHVELGIALMQNKNILRVTGRSVSDAPFDIRQLALSPYRDDTSLIEIIIKYLDMFLKIKQLPFHDDNAPLYRKLLTPLQLNAATKPDHFFTNVLDASPDLILRDGGIRVSFSIRQSVTRSDWFGICFRVGDATPWTGCHMVYVRHDGSIDLATYPGPLVVNLSPPGPDMEKQQTLTIDFENDFLRVRMETIERETFALTHQRAGRIVLVAYQTEVDVASAEIVCRDTIEWESRR
jgi:nucleoside 2-deoxyribosyltransferase